MVKVSVVIPVYNVEKYLRECLDSIANQTLQDIEIICINDGSTDNSLEILNEYAEKDNRFVIISQKNQGQAVARNKGMELIKGDYFCFMDADDILDLNTFEECYNLITSKSLDFVMYKLINFNDDDKEFYTTPGYDMTAVRNIVKEEVFNYNTLRENMFLITVSPVNKLFRTEFVLNSNARFPEGTIFEDNLFYWRLFFNAKRIYFLDKYYYKRRRHSSSTTGEGNARWVDALEIYNGVWDIFKEFGHFEEYKFKLYNNKINFAKFRIDNIQEEYKDLFFQAWKNDLTNVINNYMDFIDLLNEDHKRIFYSVMSSENYNEYVLMLNLYKMNDKIISLENKLNTITNSTDKLLKLNNNYIHKVTDENRALLNKNNNLDYEKLNAFAKNEQLTDSNTNLDKEIHNVISNNQKLLKENQYLKDKLHDTYIEKQKLSDENKQLNWLLEELKLIKENNEELLSSNSWKFTKPARKLRNIIKK